MRGCLLLVVVTLVGLMESVWSLPDDPAEYQAWEERTLQEIEALRDAPDEQAISELGRHVYRLSRLGVQEKGDRPAYRAAKAMLEAIPDHAIWYEKKIRELTEKDIDGGSNFSGERAWCFQTLEQLQTKESVRVLGELLFDERDPWKGEGWGDGGRPFANSWHAVKALHGMGSRNPPVVRKFVELPEDVRTWQLWFEQIRAGTRTFSFKGSEVVYRLGGSAAVEGGGGLPNTKTASGSSTESTG